MRLIVDTNRIIAALIRDSSSRRILLSPKFEFISIRFGEKEVYKYKEEIITKANISAVQFEKLINTFSSKLSTLDDSSIESYMAEAKEIMGKIDTNDTPFIAAALSKNCGIWSDDAHFQKQNKVKAWKTEELLKLL